MVESEARDAERFQLLFRKEGFEIVLCDSGATAELVITSDRDGFAAAIILWEIPGPPFGFSLLARCRKVWPKVPVVIVSGMLDAALATRAFALGARDFLEKPLDSDRVLSCLRSLLAADDPLSPLVDGLRRTIVGQSPALIAAFKQIARVIPKADSRVLFIGESGTGKELFAQAVHQLGPQANAPLVAVNVGEIPDTLIESALFGHEKGSFTGATARRIGYLEEAKSGTLFLDEIGELEITLQVKLLRVIQEKKFRRIGGEDSLNFNARLVCATNRDLAQAVKQGTFRQDLFHRIAEVTVQIPPLRERSGDVDALLDHFLDVYRNGRNVKLARETRTILRSYTFPGNVRELQNLVRSALIECDGEVILPQHLPLRNMKAFLQSTEDAPSLETVVQTQPGLIDPPYHDLFNEIASHLPGDWIELPYREIARINERAFDRIYLKHALKKAKHNVTRAAAKAGIDVKTFRKRWKDCGLSPLGFEEEDSDG